MRDCFCRNGEKSRRRKKAETIDASKCFTPLIYRSESKAGPKQYRLISTGHMTGQMCRGHSAAVGHRPNTAHPTEPFLGSSTHRISITKHSASAAPHAGSTRTRWSPAKRIHARTADSSDVTQERTRSGPSSTHLPPAMTLQSQTTTGQWQRLWPWGY